MERSVLGTVTLRAAALAAVGLFFFISQSALATESSPSFQNDGSLYWSAGNATSSSFNSAESGYYTSGSGSSASFVESGGNALSFPGATASSSPPGGGTGAASGGSTTYLAYLHIDGGAPMTSSAGVTLSLNANFTPVTMTVARRPDFLDGVTLPFQPSYFPWMLCGQPSCVPGTYAVYVRLVGGSGIGVDVLAAINLITDGFTGPRLPEKAAPGSRSPASGQPGGSAEVPVSVPPARPGSAPGASGSVPSVSTGSPSSGAEAKPGVQPPGKPSKPNRSSSSSTAASYPSSMPLKFLLYGFGGLVLLILLLLWRAKRV